MGAGGLSSVLPQETLLSPHIRPEGKMPLCSQQGVGKGIIFNYARARCSS